MTDFSINFANDVLTTVDFSLRKILLGMGGLFCQEWGNTFTFKSNILRILHQNLAFQEKRRKIRSYLSTTNRTVS